MRTVMRIKWIRVIGEALITLAMIMGLGWVLFHAVLQESYRTYKPTPEELQDDPSLAIYLEDEGK